jgi:cytoskeletal protein RodZ
MDKNRYIAQIDSLGFDNAAAIEMMTIKMQSKQPKKIKFIRPITVIVGSAIVVTVSLIASMILPNDPPAVVAPGTQKATSQITNNTSEERQTGESTNKSEASDSINNSADATLTESVTKPLITTTPQVPINNGYTFNKISIYPRRRCYGATT